MTNQEIFDKVARHLLTQKRQSLGPLVTEGTGCAYRGEDGLKCAVGCLIDDEHYSEYIEGRVVEDEFVRGALRASGVSGGVPLLSSLQDIHDRCPVDSWHTQLVDAAQRYGLSPAVLEEFH